MRSFGTVESWYAWLRQIVRMSFLRSHLLARKSFASASSNSGLLGGFVALDGISLTVTERVGSVFSVALIAYTQTHVALVDKGIGDVVNLEVDVLAKYVESILGDRVGTTGGAP